MRLVSVAESERMDPTREQSQKNEAAPKNNFALLVYVC
jgi:hypothetical protein